MRHALFPLLSAAVLFAPSAQARAADEAKAIIQKAINAHGGEKVLEKYKALQSKSKGKLDIPGVGEVEFTQEVSLMAPDKLKEALELDIGGRQIQVVTRCVGKKISIEADGKEVPVTDAIKKAIQTGRHVVKANRLTGLLKDKGYTFETLGEIKVEGKAAVGVRVIAKGQPDINLYFDKTTGLLAKTEYRTVNPTTGKEITEERIIVEYQKKNEQGLTLPKKVLVKHDDKKHLEVEVTEIKSLEKLDDSEFTKDS
jgi:hypothetical protein